MQEFIVYFIIVLAVCWTVWQVWRKLKDKKKNCGSSCAGCPLKDKCSK